MSELDDLLDRAAREHHAAAPFDPACAECGGACCRSFVIPLPPAPLVSGARAYLQIRGRIERGFVRLPAPCPKLTDGGTCSVWDSRPGPCRLFAVGSDARRDAIAAHHDATAAARVVALLPGPST
jgi:hypothetical protein